MTKTRLRGRSLFVLLAAIGLALTGASCASADAGSILQNGWSGKCMAVGNWGNISATTG